MTVATIVYNKRKLLRLEEESMDEMDALTAVYVVYQKIGTHSDSFDTETIIAMALKYLELVPPEELLKL